MLYCLKDVIKELTISKSTIYRLIKDGVFPKQFPLSSNRVAWEKSEIDEYIVQSKLKKSAPQEKKRGV
jgi:prophage regulatory protein